MNNQRKTLIIILLITVVFGIALLVVGLNKNDKNEDTVEPVITVNDSLSRTFNVGTGEPDWTTYFDVNDNVDGKITVTDEMIEDNVDMTKAGSYTVKITVRDNAGNVATETITIRIVQVDTVAPRIDVNDELTKIFAVDSEEPDWKEYFTVTDDVDGNIAVTDEMIDSSAVDMTKAGSYTITITVADSSGNSAEKTINIEVKEGDVTAPNIEVIDTLSTKVDVDSTTPNWTTYFTVTDDVDKEIEVLDTMITAKPDMSEVGRYDLTIVVQDSSGNEASKTIEILITNKQSDFVIDSSGQITEYVGAIRGVIIPDEIDGIVVTSIGESAFFEKNLTSVIIPDSVTIIEIHAFQGNNALEKVELGNGVVSIENDAFAGHNLSNITIPTSVTTIGDEVFYSRYSNLNSVTIPANVTMIGRSAFGSILNVVVEGDETNSVTRFNDNWNIFELNFPVESMPGVINENGFMFWNGTIVGYIGNDSYVEIPSEIDGVAVKKIGTAAFANTGSVKKVLVPLNVTEFADRAFVTKYEHEFEIGFDGILFVEYNNEISKDRIDVMHTMFFGEFKYINLEGDTSGLNISVNDKLPTEFTAGDDIPDWKTYFSVTDTTDGEITVTDEMIINTVTDKSWVTDFYYKGDYIVKILVANSNGDTKSEIITIKVNVLVLTADDITFNETIGEIEAYNSFARDIIIPKEINGIAVKSIGRSAFGRKYIKSVVIPEGVTNIGAAAFEGLQNDSGGFLTEIIIPDSVITIGAAAFYFNRISEVIIPDGVESIGELTFSENDLTSIIIPDSVKIIEELAFSDNKLTSIIIPDSVESIGYRAFAANKISDLTIGSNITSDNMYLNAFEWNPIENITINGDENRFNYTWVERQFSVELMPNVIIHDGLVFYDGWIFVYIGNKTDIVIPNEINGVSVDFIGAAAFEGKNITSVIIPDSVTSIGERAFFGNLITNISIPVGVTTIGELAFTENKITELILSDNVKTIGNSAFYNNKITSLTLPSSLETLDNDAFRYNEITELTMENVIENMGSYVFSDNKITSLVLPDNMTTISNGMFSNNKITSVLLPDGLTTIGSYAFENNKITNVVFPESITTIDWYAFKNNEITEITFPSNLETIEIYAFYNNKITNVILPYSLTTIGYRAFYNNSIESVTVEGVETRFNNSWTDIGFPAELKPN